MNQNPGKVAVCEIELKNGRTCGVSAIGRCTTCERAFCRSHQARMSTNIDANGRFMPFSVPVELDMCQGCFASSPIELSRIKAEEDAARYEQEKKEEERKRAAPYHEAYEYVISGVAQTALRTCGVQQVEIHKIVRHQETKKGFFGQKSRWVDEVVSVQRGWIIGELSWKYTEDFGYGDSAETTGNFLTALLDKEGVVASTGAVVRVERYSGGYKDITSSSDHISGWDLEIAEAVRRLTRMSS